MENQGRILFLYFDCLFRFGTALESRGDTEQRYKQRCRRAVMTKPSVKKCINVTKTASVMGSFTNVLLVVTAILTALIAGLFYAYSCSVNIGLGRLPDVQYLAAMQSINRAIQNPLFLASFLGTMLLLPLSTYVHYGQPVSLRFWLLLTATIVYLLVVFGVTVFGNVPLNEALEAFPLAGASLEEITKQRTLFEAPWNSFHTIRTLGAVLSLALVILACLYPTSVAKAG